MREAPLARLLAALTMLIVAAVAAALVVPRLIDWNDYRTTFEAEATKIFGRAVRIEGNINLVILPTPTLNMRGVRVADEMGSFTRPFAEVESFDMVLSLRALLSGTVEAKQLQLDQPIIRLVVDELGEGNWQSVRPHNFSLPIQQVILNQANIKDGAIEFRRGKSTKPLRVDRITGTFSADSLSGPFRYNGSAFAGGELRELHVTASQQDNAAQRLKGTVRAASGNSLYQLDGDIKGLEGALQYTGPVVVRIALDKAARESSGGLADVMPGKALELRASSVISLEDVRLENIAFTLTQDDRPQSLSGSAYASWGDKPRLDIAVESSWFDIDQLLHFGGEEQGKPTPAAAIAALPKLFEGWAFKPKQGAIIAKIQQAGLGGEMIEGLDLSVLHDAGAWKIEKLIAQLPGDTAIDIKGTVPGGETFTMKGDIKLNGRNLSRLLRWAVPSLGAVDAGNAPRFSLNGNMALTAQKIEFKGAKGELGDSTFSGDLVYDYGAASQLVLSLQSERLDLRNVFGDGDLVSSATANVGMGGIGEAAPPTPAAPAAKASLADVARTVFQARSTQVSVRVEQLQLSGLEARDVRSVLRYEDGTLDIRELNLATTDGLSIKADGRVTDFGQKPNGAINLAINAPSAPAVANLARLMGLDGNGAGAAAQRRTGAFAPLRVNGSLNASKENRTLELTLAGNAAGSELTFSGRLDGDFTDLNNSKLDVNGVIGNADGRRLIAQLAPEVPLDGTPATGGSGALNVTASGALKTGLTGRIELRTPEAEGRFNGRIAPLDEPWSLDGDLSIKASQASTVLSMLRLSPGGTPVGGEIDLHTAITKKGTVYSISALDLRIGGETIGGRASIDVAGERPVADIDIGADSIFLPKLAAYFVDWDRKDVTSQLAEATAGQSFWPGHAFSFRAFEAAGGKARMHAKTLMLTDGITLSEGTLEATLKDGALTVSKLNGQLYDGAFTGSGKLSAARGRITLDARVKLEKADLARITLGSDGKPLAKTRADLDLTLGGEGFSPRGLIAIMSGKGQLSIQKGSLSGISPAALKTAADGYLGEEAAQKERWTTRLGTDVRKGTLNHPAITVPVTVKDGLLQIQGAAFEGTDYKASVDLTTDLSALRLDSEWLITTRAKSKAGEDLPPVKLVFAGPVSEFATLQPQIDSDELQRFLSLKRMERDMDRLEKLNGQTSPATPPRNTTGANVTGSKGNAESSATAPPAPPPPAPAAAPASASQPVRERERERKPPPAPRMSDAPKVVQPPLDSWEAPGWATDTEEKAAPQRQETSQEFEARIRRALRSSETPAQRRDRETTESLPEEQNGDSTN